MSDFDHALEFVSASLRRLRESGSTRRGSREALRRLAVAARASPTREVLPPPERAPESGAPIDQTATPSAARAPGQLPPLARATEPESGEVGPATPAAAATPPAGAPLPAITGSKEERIAQLRALVAPCTRCPHLARTRTQTVFGVGNIHAEIMFVGEAPGADEDLQGEPFVGKAGQLLTKIIEAMGLSREQVFIANVLKCRPDMPAGESGNRRPTGVEMQTCLPYLREQIAAIQPRALVALGSVAMEGLLNCVEPMARLRGRWHEFQGIPLMATYHPAYLLRNQSLTEKRKVWEDMLRVMERVQLPISEKQRAFFTKA